MNGARAFKVTGVAALLLAVQVGAAVPCGFHGGLGDGFSAMHPKSIDVALRFATPPTPESSMLSN